MTGARHDDTSAALAAINARNAEVSRQAEVMLRVFLAMVVGVLLALALLHWATPCADATLCLLPAVPAPGWLTRAVRRLHILVLRVRERQLMATAMEQARDDNALRLATTMARAASIRLQRADLERRAAHDRTARQWAAQVRRWTR